MLPSVESVRSPVATMKLGAMTDLPVVTSQVRLLLSWLPLVPIWVSEKWTNQKTRSVAGLYTAARGFPAWMGTWVTRRPRATNAVKAEKRRADVLHLMAASLSPRPGLFFGLGELPEVIVEERAGVRSGPWPSRARPWIRRSARPLRGRGRPGHRNRYRRDRSRLGADSVRPRRGGPDGPRRPGPACGGLPGCSARFRGPARAPGSRFRRPERLPPSCSWAGIRRSPARTRRRRVGDGRIGRGEVLTGLFEPRVRPPPGQTPPKLPETVRQWIFLASNPP